MKKLILNAVLSLVVFTLIFVPTLVKAQGLVPEQCKGGAQNCNPCAIIGLLASISDWVVGISAVAALVMFVVGGILMIANYGNANLLAMGKQTITATVVGIIIVFLAWTFINTLISAIYGSDSTIFGKFINTTGLGQQNQWFTGPCSTPK